MTKELKNMKWTSKVRDEKRAFIFHTSKDVDAFLINPSQRPPVSSSSAGDGGHWPDEEIRRSSRRSGSDMMMDRGGTRMNLGLDSRVDVVVFQFNPHLSEVLPFVPFFFYKKFFISKQNPHTHTHTHTHIIIL